MPVSLSYPHLYYVIRDGRIILLLCGGNKSTQERDIQKVRAIVKQPGEKS